MSALLYYFLKAYQGWVQSLHCSEEIVGWFGPAHRQATGSTDSHAMAQVWSSFMLRVFTSKQFRHQVLPAWFHTSWCLSTIWPLCKSFVETGGRVFAIQQTAGSTVPGAKTMGKSALLSGSKSRATTGSSKDAPSTSMQVILVHFSMWPWLFVRRRMGPPSMSAEASSNCPCKPPVQMAPFESLRHQSLFSPLPHTNTQQ